jgi:uncharacterized protein with ParB-like and HNH nuclease domain
MDISPDKQSIEKLFGTTTYYIDFYQRDYKWTAEPVTRLLDDIFYSFDAAYEKNSSLDPKPETVSAKYPWYYLSTYVTNTIDGRVYVVDGQQRLTTLTLILINLLHRSEKWNCRLSGWLRSKIAGQSGFEDQFWMNHERHISTLQSLYDGEVTVETESGITAVNMLNNYNTIDNYLESELDTKHKFETFVFYFLQRLVLINLAVEQTDVPMVFEVINDRGVRLRPYEILKGKLLGQIDKIELDQDDYNGLWEKCVGRVNAHKTEEIDVFFVYYLKAKFAESRGTGQRFDNDYHREMFKPDLSPKLKLERNASEVKQFLKGEFDYFTALYSKIWSYAASELPGYECLYYNRLNEMDSQFLLILSACKAHDPEENEKIKLVATNIDRMFALLRLQRAYDSNEFNEAVFDLSNQIRNASARDINAIFEKKLIELLIDRRGVAVENPLEYAQFRNTSINDIPTRFTRYFFARVDKFIADGTKTGVKHPFGDLITKTGTVNGFHIEHILSNNAENVNLYGGNSESFEMDRNRLGAVLLLKGKDNISSNNESFSKKLKSYANTLHWNETLREDTYKSKKDFTIFMKENGFNFQHYDEFGSEEVENRQKLLFGLTEKIWGFAV